MEEEYSVTDPTQLLEAASDFAHNPGFLSDASTQEFLNRFPLPVIINALQTKGDVPGLENALVASLEKIFATKYGASLIPQYMPFVVVGLGADSQKVRHIACKTVSSLLEYSDETNVSATRLLVEYDVYPLLLKCLIDGDEQVATASMDAIRKLAGSPERLGIVFPANANETTHLRNVAAGCSSLGRVRVLALVVKLFSISSSVASAVYNSNLLSLLEAELSNENDTLVTLNVLELFYELAENQHSTEFLSRTTLLQILTSVISNMSIGSILRARAMTIIGRLLSKEDFFMFTDESSVETVISAVDGRLGLLESQDADEFECTVEALGQIGTTIRGATLLLTSSPPTARHVVDAAFDQHGRGKQLAALHALGNVTGETRSESNRMLNIDAEERLRLLIYEAASKSSKLTPSGLLLSVLQQESEIRLAGYRLITGLVARPWCLMEICSRQEIINIVTDPYAETTKIGMEARHNCCQAISKALLSSPKLTSDPALAGIAAKLDEAIRRGPYLARKNSEAQPAVATADRF
jgi:26S proteasome non-ATPase regulatory subunit 5